MTATMEISSPPTQLDAAIDRATEALLAKQAPGGWWVGELQGDSILESEYLLLKWILGQEADPDLPQIANFLRRRKNVTRSRASISPVWGRSVLIPVRAFRRRSFSCRNGFISICTTSRHGRG